MDGKNRFEIPRLCIGSKGIASRTRRGVAIIALGLLPACNVNRGNGQNGQNKSVISEPATVVMRIDSALASRTYKITDMSAGPFRIGAVIRDSVAEFEVEKATESKTATGGAAVERSVYTYYIGNEGWVRVAPQYDPATGQETDKIGEIFVYSDLFLTDWGIGAVSSLEEFANTYPDINIRYIGEDDMFAAVTPQLPHVEFLLGGAHYVGTAHGSDSGFHGKLNVSDFEDNSYFTAIRICQKRASI